MPAQDGGPRAVLADGSIEVVGANLDGAKYTLAVPDYLYDAGLHDFARHPALRRRSWTTRSTASSRATTAIAWCWTMIEEDAVRPRPVSSWSSRASRACSRRSSAPSRRSEPIVFLGWEPHPMNTRFDMRYLTGGDATLRPQLRRRDGLHATCARATSQECPNVGRLLAEPAVHARRRERGHGRASSTASSSPEAGAATGCERIPAR